MRSLFTSLRRLSAALRMLLIFTVLLGVLYPLAITLIAQLPGLKSRADGSLLRVDGKVVGSGLIGQSFTDSHGNPLLRYFQSRPSAAGAGYDPTASSASNLGPESIVDTLPNPALKGDTGKQSLLTQVCARSLAIGRLYAVDGARPFCTTDGVGAVLAAFWSGPGYHGHVTRAVSVNQACPARPFLATYHGVRVECARYGADYSHGQIVPVRGDAPAHPAVPADAVTASGSGLDPEISPAYARLQENVVARARGITLAQVRSLVSKYEKGRDLGFLGEPRVNVLRLNLALDRLYPVTGR
jgi:K+-transporting ATPase ATPase C chain